MDLPKSLLGGTRLPVKRVLSRYLAGALVMAFAMSGTPNAVAGDPCKMVLCMYGKLAKSKGEGDDGGGECRSAEAEYFGIIVYKKKKKIDWSATAKERLSRQNKCSSADRGITKQINDKFGKVLG